jgi:hypothetical protein
LNKGNPLKLGEFFFVEGDDDYGFHVRVVIDL